MTFRNTISGTESNTFPTIITTNTNYIVSYIGKETPTFLLLEA